MTNEEYRALYYEVSKVIYTRLSTDLMTPAQSFFTKAFEAAAFDVSFLECYAEVVDEFPEIRLRNLHALCLGYGLGHKMGKDIIKPTNNTNH